MIKASSLLICTSSLFLAASGMASAQVPVLDTEQAAFLTLINSYRAQNGLGPLKVSIALENSSQWMSVDMATKNYFSHTDSLGRDPFTRMATFGYQHYPEGENIAAGNSTAQQTLIQWQTACDPDASGNCTYAHRQNMLNPGFVVIGIGRFYSPASTYGWYWTTDFGGYVDATLGTGSDMQPPTVPTLLAATVRSATEVDLNWTASADNVAVAGYQIVRNGAVLTSVSGSTLSYADVSVGANTTYSYTVKAFDAAGNYSTASNTIQATTFGPSPGGSNLARGKSATQSSTYPGYSSTAASSAVDGNTDGIFFHGSVTHTLQTNQPWWQVDLGASASIGSIAIWNRTDCCMDRLSDYWVFVSNTPFGPSDTPATLQSRAGTWSTHQTGYPNPSSVLTVNATGRYVRVQLSGYNYLSLAEVEVFGTSTAPGSGLAVGKPATQSSTYPSFAGTSASSAVDGSTDGNFFHNSVTHTLQAFQPWWQVDLGASASITSVVIWNRTDCCMDRLSDYWVFVSNTPFGPNDTPATLQSRAGTWSSHQTGYPNPSSAIPVNATGRYVRVQLNGLNYLSLAEVQVFGN